MPAVFAKPDFGFSSNASKHTKARKQAGLRLHPCQAGLCLLSAPSQTSASRRVRQSIQKRENKPGCACTPVNPDCACRSCIAGLRLLSGVYDGYGISPYEGQGRAFSCEKICKSGFPNRRGKGCPSSFRGGYCGSEAGGRKRPPPPKQLHTLKIAEHGRFSRCCWGCCADACADATARSANGRARAFRPLLPGDVVPTLARTRPHVLRMAERGRGPAFCMTEVRFLHRRRHVRTYGEWQSTGVLRLLYVRGTIPSSASARFYIRQMAERRRSVRCC